ncbi:MAG: NGG1p interacting factor NIF3 [Candidatus Magasanikbacteria bacterium]|nr:NGG1p interacting factor NIF3 [Candidatus Magasanikbacteria bacterium]
MHVKQIFELGLKRGMEADPRGKKVIARNLARQQKEYDDLKPSHKKYFDLDRLTNPYPDCAIHVDNGKTAVRRVLAGIDISAAEILLASQLNERGQTIDLVISHHPVGKALVNLHQVMELTADVYEQEGIPIHVAEKIMEERRKEVGRGVHPLNQFQVIDMAKILGINFISTHTITDNMVDKFIRDMLYTVKPEQVQDIIDMLLTIPEYDTANHFGSGPRIVSGSPHHRIGKFMVEMTGGTNPSSKVYQELSQYGFSTIVGMHMKDESLTKAEKHYMNVIIAGHMSSDSLGMNLFLDELEKQGIEVIPCGGLIRISRNTQKSTDSADSRSVGKKKGGK